MDLELNWHTREDVGKGFDKLMGVLGNIANSLEVIAKNIDKTVDVSDEDIAELYRMAQAMRNGSDD